MRGLIYDVLRHRFPAWLAVLFQSLLFLAVPIALTLIQTLIAPIHVFKIDLSYILILFFFGICLQLLRLWTGSLWTSIGFHIAYLEIGRFVLGSREVGAPSILTFHESLLGISSHISLGMNIIGAIILSIVILSSKRLRLKITKH
ncbi:CPBP family intramembrane metalloprotease [Paenibacillus sp. GSMTC-2017]|nr:CPBP family intramembrane metalloprotease [Paenibacillus sp. GSMTC-2017]